MLVKLFRKFFSRPKIYIDKIFVKPKYGVSFDPSIKLDDLPIIKEETKVKKT